MSKNEIALSLQPGIHKENLSKLIRVQFIEPIIPSKQFVPRKSWTALFLIFFFSLPLFVQAQSKLNKEISIHVKKKPIEVILNDISNKAQVTFSYNSRIISQDSLTTIDVDAASVKSILVKLLGPSYEFSETGKFIVILKKSEAKPSRVYYIFGHVYDAETRQSIADASVYDRKNLTSTLTLRDGFFRLPLTEGSALLALSVSKDLYIDTFFAVSRYIDKELAIYLTPQKPVELAPVVVSKKVEHTWFGRLILSPAQIVQGLNIKHLLARKPVQFSLIPKWNTHGPLGADIVNNFSMNIIGGYTAGTDGVEIGSIFNIVRGNSGPVQVAGITNVVGGKIHGVQIAGVINYGLSNASGVQTAGVANKIHGNMKGVQLSGIHNHTDSLMKGVQVTAGINVVKDSMKGVQLGVFNDNLGDANGVMMGAIYNLSKKDFKGVQFAEIMNTTKEKQSGAQIAGLGNIAKEEMRGVQFAFGFNYTKRLKGLQVGLVNISDSSSGCAIGLINISKNGYHQVEVFSADVLPFNVAYKSGNPKLYSISTIGANFFDNHKAYSVGFGLGRQWQLSNPLSLFTDITIQNLWLGSWKKTSSLYRIQPSLRWHILNRFNVFGGISLSILSTQPLETIQNGYQSDFSKSGIANFKLGSAGHGWIGWRVGIGF